MLSKTSTGVCVRGENVLDFGRGVVCVCVWCYGHQEEPLRGTRQQMSRDRYVRGVPRSHYSLRVEGAPVFMPAVQGARREMSQRRSGLHAVYAQFRSIECRRWQGAGKRWRLASERVCRFVRGKARNGSRALRTSRPMEAGWWLVEAARWYRQVTGESIPCTAMARSCCFANSTSQCAAEAQHPASYRGESAAAQRVQRWKNCSNVRSSSR